MSTHAEIPRLALRLRRLVFEAGPKGIIRSQLQLKLGINADHLDDLLTHLPEVKYLQKKPKHRVGRVAICYVHVGHYEAALTGFGVSPISSTPESESASQAAPLTCRQCGKGLAMPPGERVGRPRLYCSRTCQIRANSGAGVRAILDRAPEGPVRVQVAMHLVCADLVAHGFQAAHVLGRPNRLVAIGAEDVAIPLSVYVVGEGGSIPDVSFEPCAAIVTRDGTIEYHGQNPLVVEEVIDENAFAALIEED